MIFVQFQDPWTHTPTVLPGMASHKPDVDETNEAFDLDDGLKQVAPPPSVFFSSDVLLLLLFFFWISSGIMWTYQYLIDTWILFVSVLSFGMIWVKWVALTRTNRLLAHSFVVGAEYLGSCMLFF